MSAPCLQWARAHQPAVQWNCPNVAENNSSSASHVAFPVRLLPLDDSHFDALFAAGGRDESVAKFSPPANPAVFESAQHMREHYNVRTNI